MPKLHYSNDSGGPVCGVFRKQHREVTSNIDEVNCRSCIRWEAYVRHDVSLFERIYA
jgi:hypothetical protein